MGNNPACCTTIQKDETTKIASSSSCCALEQPEESRSIAAPGVPSANLKVLAATEGEKADINGIKIENVLIRKELPKKHKIILQLYAMDMSPEGIAGEGSFCACRRAVVLESRIEVAVKVYRANTQGADVMKRKFERQIGVLKELARPLRQEESPSSGLWGPALQGLDVRSAFVQLVDYSSSKPGIPGPDPQDGGLYCITDMADYSMKDYISELYEAGKRPGAEEVKNMAASALTAVAALHAKGFVHLDIKPENLMWSHGHWKLIDVDGCVPFGKVVTLEDETISFSAVYCAPEWARFVLDSESNSIKVHPCLDVWSIGVTIAELITLYPMYHSQFAAALVEEEYDAREATVSFLDWLGAQVSDAHLPPEVLKADAGFVEILKGMLLVPSDKNRSAVVQCLDHQYIKSSSATSHQQGTMNVRRRVRPPIPEDSNAPPGHSGLLWKLNQEGDPLIVDQWARRDMWLIRNGSLCYFSKKENRGLVLLEAGRLMKSTLKILEKPSCQAYGFEILSEGFESTTLAAESDQLRQEWMKALKQVSTEGRLAAPTMRVDRANIQEMRQMRLKSRNRRSSLTSKDNAPDLGVAPQGKPLWKLNTDGNPRRPEDWLQRNMWLANDGSLCYHSKKEQKPLVYYSAVDIRKSTIRALAHTEAILPHAFSVQLPPQNGLEFEPGMFAAKSAAERDDWLGQLERIRNNNEQNSSTGSV